MQKDFQKWHDRKSRIDNIEKRPFFHIREIWHCHLGVNVGFEQDGVGGDFLRPVIILRKFNNEIFWGIPLTRGKMKINANAKKYYYEFSFIPDVKSVAILSQIRLIDARRLNNIIGEVSKVDFVNLTKKLKALIP
jgi:mRNA interferase MazF